MRTAVKERSLAVFFRCLCERAYTCRAEKGGLALFVSLLWLLRDTNICLLRCNFLVLHRPALKGKKDVLCM